MITVVFMMKLRDDVDLAAFQRDAGLMLERQMDNPEFEFVDAKIYQAEDGEMITVARYGSEQGLKAWRDDPDHQLMMERGRVEYFEKAWLGDWNPRIMFNRGTGTQYA